MQAVSTPSPALPSRAWLMWAVGVSAYFLAFFHRVVLGVAGGEAADRLGVAQGALGVFTFVQLGTYLAMQIPAGLAADRLGPRRTLTIGLVSIAVGETLFAASTSLPLAILGRLLVGAGDAVTFINVLRISQSWFPPGRQALLAALTAAVGGGAQLVATIPLEASLSSLGWGGTFAVTIAVTVALTVIAIVVVRDRPPGVAAPPSHEHPPILATLAEAWARTGTRHAFFAHMSTLAPFAIVMTIWGVPYLEHSQGMSHSQAASYLLIAAVSFFVGLLGVAAVGGRGLRVQNTLVLVPPTLLAISLAVLLAWPGTVAPRGLVASVLALLGAAGAASVSCFDIARRETPAVAVGSAVAIVNCGGFLSAAVGAGLVGLLLGGDPGPSAYEHALLPVVLGITVVGLAQSVRLARRRELTGGQPAVRTASQTAATSPAAGSPAQACTSAAPAAPARGPA